MKLTVEEIARVCHEANKSFCESMGDLSQPSWEEAPAWQRTSAVNGVTYHMANPNSTPYDSHNNWLKDKEADGWRYGPVKDPELKEHPCMVHYGELPAEQRAKDYIFLSIVRTLTNI